MSEEDRSRLYAWLREQTDEPLAEYLMSCLPAAPLSDLVTKQHLEAVLSAEFSEFALKMGVQRDGDREALAAQREADRKEMAAYRQAMVAQREADGKEAAAYRQAMVAQREADRDLASKRHRLLVGAAIVLAVEIVAAEAGWLRWLTDLLASAL